MNEDKTLMCLQSPDLDKVVNFWFITGYGILICIKKRNFPFQWKNFLLTLGVLHQTLLMWCTTTKPVLSLGLSLASIHTKLSYLLSLYKMDCEYIFRCQVPNKHFSFQFWNVTLVFLWRLSFSSVFCFSSSNSLLHYQFAGRSYCI